MDITSLGITSVASITAICFLICEVAKAAPLDKKWLPVIAGVSGAVLGIAALYIMPQYPASDYITAIAVGIVSGLAATGINQIYKQLSVKKEE
jgi:hypothetical protein